MKAISLTCLLILLLIMAAVPSASAQTTLSTIAAGETPPVEPPPADYPSGRALVPVTGCAKYRGTNTAISGALLIAYNRNYREITRTTTGANGCGTVRIGQGSTIYLRVYKVLGNPPQCWITSPDAYDGYTGWFQAATSTRTVWGYPLELC